MRAPLPALLLIALIPAALAPALARESAALPGPIPAEVLEVVDGDTLSVRATIWLGQMVETLVRLEGVDTPELRARCPREKEMAIEARELTRRLVADGPVRLLEVQADKYGGRVRARVLSAGGTDLAHALLTAGLARPYGGEKRQPWCEGV
ncbi:thermonuclease family protein [Azospirillum sp. ST 5-10]|uniref:thermonuclease family protein n=1 Tax=unclassified Azospirillum TaxID=2630922 RepID=UPI003F49F0DC